MAADPAKGTHAARFRAACVALLAAVTACTAPDDSRAAAEEGANPATAVATPDSAVRARPGYVVDSILPIEEELRRFQAGLPRRRELDGAAPSREALVRQFVARLQARDSAGLRALVLTAPEFAHLVYPASSYTRPPYRTAPGLVWMQLSQNGETGLRRLLRPDFRVARYHAHACGEGPTADGNVVLWRQCSVDVTLGDGRRTTARLFGVIVEHRGRFKFANYHSDF